MNEEEYKKLCVTKKMETDSSPINYQYSGDPEFIRRDIDIKIVSNDRINEEKGKNENS